MLENITSPSILKTLSAEDLKTLSSEIRNEILSVVSKNGGHLSSNLGMVEATVALHTVFDAPKDKIIFDVGHQCYAHKLLTGRYEKFSTLRQMGGISGFPNRDESEHDIFTEGHSGTSVSSALGVAAAAKLCGSDEHTVAVVGDGSLTNGMIYEALNNCAGKNLRLIILINDNEMSISRNIGGLHNYLDKIRTSSGYFNLKHRSERILAKIPLVGKALAFGLKKIKDLIKRIFVSNNLFEDLGLDYLGPVKSDNISDLCRVLEEAKSRTTPCVVHMITKKGRGYAPAEKEPDKYHSVGAFDIDKGVVYGNKTCFSEQFGNIICDMAARDGKICAITAAMCDGTGLRKFADTYPDRFFDVGIAEEHAVTFAAGLAAHGMKPVLAIYSTFSQRTFDQLLHDISIQHLPLTLVLDRAGFVAGDGVTHQGIFDYPLIAAIPDSEIYNPENYDELKDVLDKSLKSDKLSVIRIPKGAENNYRKRINTVNCGDFEYTENIKDAKTVIFTSGRLTKNVFDAVEHDGIGIVKLIKTHPIDMKRLDELTCGAEKMYLIEEGCRHGGYAETIGCEIGRGRAVIKAVDGLVTHGSVEQLDRIYGFSSDMICSETE